MRVGARTGRLRIAGASTAGRPGRHGSYRHGSAAHLGRRRRSWNHDHPSPNNHYGDAGDHHTDEYDDHHPDEYDDHRVPTVHHRPTHHDRPGSRRPVHGGHSGR